MDEKRCECGEVMVNEGHDECEPLIVYRCPKCKKTEHIRLNGYEG